LPEVEKRKKIILSSVLDPIFF
jgi:hypothetical protein